MDKTILPETYLSEGDLGGEDTIATTPVKKTRKWKGKKTQKRSKSASAVSSTSEVSPARAKGDAQADEECGKQVMQELHLSSEGSDSDVQEGTDNASKSTNPENSGMGPPVPPEVPDEEPSAPPGTLSFDQVPVNGQDTPVPTQPEVNPPDPGTSAPDPPPMLA